MHANLKIIITERMAGWSVTLAGPMLTRSTALYVLRGRRWAYLRHWNGAQCPEFDNREKETARAMAFANALTDAMVARLAASSKRAEMAAELEWTIAQAGTAASAM